MDRFCANTTPRVLLFKIRVRLYERGVVYYSNLLVVGPPDNR